MKRLNLVNAFNHPRAAAGANAAQLASVPVAGVAGYQGRKQRSKNKGRSQTKKNSF